MGSAYWVASSIELILFSIDRPQLMQAFAKIPSANSYNKCFFIKILTIER
ncbi:MAG: hypothetical protein ACRC62_25340 [Microcoleus sp.]